MSRADLRWLRKSNARLERRRAALLDLKLKTPELQTIVAVDFVSGGEARFARAADIKGKPIAAWLADPSETATEFRARAEAGARSLGAVRLVIGGVPDLAATDSSPILPPPRGALVLPDGPLHRGQIEALRTIQSNRFAALRCGRRFGKSSLAAALASDVAMLGGYAGVFCPIYKLSAPVFDTIARTLAPVLATSNRSVGELRVEGGGGVDVWNLEQSVWPGRGRSYRLAVLDEAAFASDELSTSWAAAIRPCLADTMGAAIVASTPSGISESNFFWRICCEASYGFAEFVAPTVANPFIDPAEIEALRAVHNAAIFSQEFLAQFVNLSGVGLFDVAAMLNKGEPWPAPGAFDVVFATLDSGVKGGQAHDASAVVYCGLNTTMAPLGLYILDWEAVELGAGDLELWFAGIGRTLAEYSLKARIGSYGVYIENAGLGEMLIAKSRALGVHAEEIRSELVARGKDLRALAAERFINGGRVRLTAQAANKVSKLKGIQRNHLLAQTAGFHIADKDAWKRSDDLVDALVYATLTAFTVT
jgi:hypothetical protein